MNKFTPEEQKIIQSAAQQVFEYIAGDLLEANEGKAIRRSVIVECVCDAGRLEEMIRRSNPDLAKRVGEAGVTVFKIVKNQFPYASYS